MKLPLTAKEDQPGPIFRRQSSTGGEADQSVAIRTPRTMLSLLGPRKPGHSGSLISCTGAAGCDSTVGVAADLSAVSGAIGASGVLAAGGETAGATGSSFASARSRSSGVAD